MDTGCASTANDSGCDDGNACTTADQCSEGVCVGGPAPECDDDNPCTDDGCDGETGCVFPANTSDCDDGDPCTLGDICAGGSCAGPGAQDCDDGNSCTSDSCDSSAGGCVHDAAAGCDPCELPADCPSGYSEEPGCDDVAACQGNRRDVACVGGVCEASDPIEDDSACDAETVALSCVYGGDQNCTGEADQEAPACAEVPPPAFPGAEGYGATSLGGRGGVVLYVDSLDDDLDDPQPGTLRHALQAEGPRTVLFKVGGVITLKDRIHVLNPFLTVAGQTAPGDGITVRMEPAVDKPCPAADDPDKLCPHGGPLIILKTHDVILRYLRLRRGTTGKQGDSLSIQDGGEQIVVDRVSITWGTDENFEIYIVSEGAVVRDVSIQRCLVAEALWEAQEFTSGHALGSLIAGNQNDGLELWRDVENISIHKNVYASNMHRNPRVASRGAKVISNLMYNWRTRAGSTFKGTTIDWWRNAFQKGPMHMAGAGKPILFHATTTSNSATDYKIFDEENGYQPASIYIEENIAPDFDEDPAVVADLEADNWHMIKDHYLEDNPYLSLDLRREEALAPAVYPVTAPLASEAMMAHRLADVGAHSRVDCDGTWVEVQDDTDRRLIDEVRELAGVASTSDIPQSPPEGYGEEVVFTSCEDWDGDGLPDAYELLHDLDPDDPLDGTEDGDDDGYTALEEYLNGTSPGWPDLAGEDADTVVWQLTTSGTAEGRVLASPGPLGCDADCPDLAFGRHQQLTFTPIPEATLYLADGDYSTFTHWATGPCAGSTEEACFTTADADGVAEAVFVVAGKLFFKTTGKGSGSIVITTKGSSCGVGCILLPKDDQVEMVAVPDPGSVFVEWTTGKCKSGPDQDATTAECSFVMPQTNLVKARFEPE